MTINEKTLEAIDKRKIELLKEMGRCTAANPGLGLKVDNSIGFVGIYKINWSICKLEELTQMIEELTILKQSIEEVTGCQF